MSDTKALLFLLSFLWLKGRTRHILMRVLTNHVSRGKTWKREEERKKSSLAPPLIFGPDVFACSLENFHVFVCLIADS